MRELEQKIKNQSSLNDREMKEMLKMYNEEIEELNSNIEKKRRGVNRANR